MKRAYKILRLLHDNETDSNSKIRPLLDAIIRSLHHIRVPCGPRPVCLPTSHRAKSDSSTGRPVTSLMTMMDHIREKIFRVGFIAKTETVIIILVRRDGTHAHSQLSYNWLVTFYYVEYASGMNDNERHQPDWPHSVHGYTIRWCSSSNGSDNYCSHGQGWFAIGERFRDVEIYLMWVIKELSLVAVWIEIIAERTECIKCAISLPRSAAARRDFRFGSQQSWQTRYIAGLLEPIGKRGFFQIARYSLPSYPCLVLGKVWFFRAQCNTVT